MLFPASDPETRDVLHQTYHLTSTLAAFLHRHNHLQPCNEKLVLQVCTILGYTCKVNKVLHLYCTFSRWICSKAHNNDQFSPSRPNAQRECETKHLRFRYLGASGGMFPHNFLKFSPDPGGAFAKGNHTTLYLKLPKRSVFWFLVFFNVEYHPPPPPPPPTPTHTHTHTHTHTTYGHAN